MMMMMTMMMMFRGIFHQREFGPLNDVARLNRLLNYDATT